MLLYIYLPIAWVDPKPPRLTRDLDLDLSISTYTRHAYQKSPSPAQAARPV